MAFRAKITHWSHIAAPSPHCHFPPPAKVAPYVFLVSFVVCNVVQIKYLQLSLAKFDALYIVPVYQGWERVAV